jgi:hypothetical protein
MLLSTGMSGCVTLKAANQKFQRCVIPAYVEPLPL